MEAPGEKFLIRLWETVERCGSGLAKPWQIRREGRAHIDVRREEAISDAKVQQELDAIRRRLSEGHLKLLPPPPQLRIRLSDQSTNNKLARQEPMFSLSREAQNISQIAENNRRLQDTEMLLNLRSTHRIAEEQAVHSPPETLPEDRVSKDWVDVWREGAEKVSDADLQTVWAKILNQEITSPGSQSLRLLQTLRTMSVKEAGAFNRICPFIVNGFVPRVLEGGSGVPGMTFNDILLLEEAGLITGAQGALARQCPLVRTEKVCFCHVLLGDKKTLTIDLKPEFAPAFQKSSEILNLPAYVLTSVGQQLYKISGQKPDDSYIDSIASYFKRNYEEHYIQSRILYLGEKMEGNVYTVELEEIVEPR